MPSSGKVTIGKRAVASISTASVSHHPAIQTIMASVARPSCVNATHSPETVEYWGEQAVAEQPEHRPAEPIRLTVAAVIGNPLACTDLLRIRVQ